MISQEDKKILAEFSERIRRVLPGAKIWAFGSRARGVATWESDFDTCIVLDRVDDAIDRQIRDIAWEVGFENDRVITTVVFDSEEFESGPMSESALVANIIKEGVAA